MTRLLVLSAALCFAMLVAQGATAQARRRAAGREASSPPAQRILFIGNSLTYTNDLPAMVCALARFRGFDAVCESVAFGGFDLRDHLREGSASLLLATQRWSLVVLQQGPSSLESSRKSLLEWTAEFEPKIVAAGARPALFAVWPADENFSSFPRVGESYRLAAQSVDGLLFPAGSAWLEAWKRDPKLPLYGPDSFHPSPLGTYLAALVMHRCIWNELPDLFADPETARSVTRLSLGIDSARLHALLDAANTPSCDPNVAPAGER